MELKQPKTGQNWKPFWGCTNFKKTGCKGSVKLNKNNGRLAAEYFQKTHEILGIREFLTITLPSMVPLQYQKNQRCEV